MQNENLGLLAGVKVLVVDDEPDALELTKTILSSHEAEVIPCASAAEGLEQLQTHMPQVIVSDISMPEMNGYQFIQAVRNHPEDKIRNTPAVALSALSEREAAAKAIKAGFQKYLRKPVNLLALIGTIAAMVAIGS